MDYFAGGLSSDDETRDGPLNCWEPEGSQR